MILHSYMRVKDLGNLILSVEQYEIVFVPDGEVSCQLVILTSKLYCPEKKPPQASDHHCTAIDYNCLTIDEARVIGGKYGYDLRNLSRLPPPLHRRFLSQEFLFIF